MAITAPQNIAWAILAAGPSGSTITKSQTVEWSIRASDPPPPGALTKSTTVTWRIFGTDTLDLILNGAPTGLEGILTIQLETADDGTLVYGPTTQAIVESPSGSGRYIATVPNPGVGTYFITWSDGANQTVEDLEIELNATEVTFARVRPPARGDGVPWDRAIILEGATAEGPWVEIETIMLSPVDTDASKPQRRTITSTGSPNLSGWYAISWADASGVRYESPPRYSTGVIQ